MTIVVPEMGEKRKKSTDSKKSHKKRKVDKTARFGGLPMMIIISSLIEWKNWIVKFSRILMSIIQAWSEAS